MWIFIAFRGIWTQCPLFSLQHQSVTWHCHCFSLSLLIVFYKKTLFKCMFLLFVAMSFPGEEVDSSCHSYHLLTVWDVQGDLSMWSDSCLKSALLPLDGIQKTPVIFHFEIPFAACYMLTRELRDLWGNEWHQHEQFVIMTQKITG